MNVLYIYTFTFFFFFISIVELMQLCFMIRNTRQQYLTTIIIDFIFLNAYMSENIWKCCISTFINIRKVLKLKLY